MGGSYYQLRLCRSHSFQSRSFFLSFLCVMAKRGLLVYTCKCVKGFQKHNGRLQPDTLSMDITIRSDEIRLFVPIGYIPHDREKGNN